MNNQTNQKLWKNSKNFRKKKICNTVKPRFVNFNKMVSPSATARGMIFNPHKTEVKPIAWPTIRLPTTSLEESPIVVMTKRKLNSKRLKKNEKLFRLLRNRNRNRIWNRIWNKKKKKPTWGFQQEANSSLQNDVGTVCSLALLMNKSPIFEFHFVETETKKKFFLANLGSFFFVFQQK